MKLFQKENTADTKYIYQTFPFPNCQTAGNSVLSTPSSNVITNHGNRAFALEVGFGGGMISGKSYGFWTIACEEDFYGTVTNSSGSISTGTLATSWGGWGRNSYLIGHLTTGSTQNGYMTMNPIRVGKNINGFKVYSFESPGTPNTVFADIILYNSSTNVFSLLSSVNITPFINATAGVTTPVINIPCSFAGDGVTHIGFSLRSSELVVNRTSRSQITILHS